MGIGSDPAVAVKVDEFHRWKMLASASRGLTYPLTFKSHDYYKIATLHRHLLEMPFTCLLNDS